MERRAVALKGRARGGHSGSGWAGEVAGIVAMNVRGG
jgi:hypothetical protein